MWLDIHLWNFRIYFQFDKNVICVAETFSFEKLCVCAKSKIAIFDWFIFTKKLFISCPGVGFFVAVDIFQSLPLSVNFGNGVFQTLLLHSRQLKTEKISCKR